MHKFINVYQLNFFLVNSFRASRAIHRALFESIFKISFAVLIANSFSFAFRLPIWRNAQLTDFLTKFLSSIDSFLINGKNFLNFASEEFLSFHANTAISANPARFSNSFFLPLHSVAFLCENGARQKRFIHT